MTRQSYGASGVGVHVGRAHGWSVFTHFQTHIGGTQAPKPKQVLGFDPFNNKLKLGSGCLLSMNSQIRVQPRITLRALTLDHRKIWVA